MRFFIGVSAIALSSVLFVGIAEAQSSAACRQNCQRILDRSRTVNSAALQRQYSACLAGCDRRARAESAYKSCMSRAGGNQAAIARCRAAYQANR